MVLYTVSRDNEKTGPCVSAWIGGSKEESHASCDASGCPMRPWAREPGAPICYAQGGQSAGAAAGMRRAAALKPAAYSLAAAIARAPRSVRMLRMSAIGDPGVIGASEASSIRQQAVAAGLRIVGYLHAWRKAEHWKGWLMASCRDLEEADEAIDAGWRATVAMKTIPTDSAGRLVRSGLTPKGRRWTACPAMLRPVADYGPRRGVDCTLCMICDASRPGPVVAFFDHGPGGAWRYRSRQEDK